MHVHDIMVTGVGFDATLARACGTSFINTKSGPELKSSALCWAARHQLYIFIPQHHARGQKRTVFLHVMCARDTPMERLSPRNPAAIFLYL